jgi:hypothetical protein
MKFFKKVTANLSYCVHFKYYCTVSVLSGMIDSWLFSIENLLNERELEAKI